MNGFGRLVHGELGRVTSYGEPEDGTGWIHYRCHWWMDPRKNASWYERQRQERTAENLAQEVDCSYDASASNRILAEFNPQRHVVSDHTWARDFVPYLVRASSILAMDFGTGPSLTALVECYYWENLDLLAVSRYRVWSEAHPDEVAQDIGAMGWYTAATPGNPTPDLVVGDPACRQRGANQRSWRDYLRDHGINVRTRRRKLEDAINRMRAAFRDGRIVLSPACARRTDRAFPSLSDSIGQYRRATPEYASSPQDYVGGIPKPRQDVNSHLCDALSYAAEWTWSRRKPRQHHGS
jgi:hypothetical protein